MHPRFLEAVQQKDYIGYLLDSFLEDSPEEQKLWIAEHQSDNRQFRKESEHHG